MEIHVLQFGSRARLSAHGLPLVDVKRHKLRAQIRFFPLVQIVGKVYQLVDRNIILATSVGVFFRGEKFIFRLLGNRTHLAQCRFEHVGAHLPRLGVHALRRGIVRLPLRQTSIDIGIDMHKQRRQNATTLHFATEEFGRRRQMGRGRMIFHIALFFSHRCSIRALVLCLRRRPCGGRFRPQCGYFVANDAPQAATIGQQARDLGTKLTTYSTFESTPERKIAHSSSLLPGFVSFLAPFGRESPAERSAPEPFREKLHKYGKKIHHFHAKTVYFFAKGGRFL